jgi:hypothetical protein
MGKDKVREEVDSLNSPASYHAGTPESPRLKKAGGLAADRRIAKQKGDSLGDSWGRPTYRFGIPGTTTGFYKPAILEEAAKARGVTSAGKQPVTRDIERGYIEDPPIPKDEHVLKATRGQIKFGDANRWEGPRPKLSQTPIEMMNLGPGGMSSLAGKQRRKFFGANMKRREHLVETPHVQQGREWGEANSKVREEIASIHEGDVRSVRLYERDVRRFMLRSRHEQCVELQARSRQPTRQGSRVSETGSSSVSAERSSSSLQVEKEASVDSISSKKSSRSFVAPTDGLAAIERVARGHGKVGVARAASEPACSSSLYLEREAKFTTINNNLDTPPLALLVHSSRTEWFILQFLPLHLHLHIHLHLHLHIHRSYSVHLHIHIFTSISISMDFCHCLPLSSDSLSLSLILFSWRKGGDPPTITLSVAIRLLGGLGYIILTYLIWYLPKGWQGHAPQRTCPSFPP